MQENSDFNLLPGPMPLYLTEDLLIVGERRDYEKRWFF
jgi:hypothetical protein